MDRTKDHNDNPEFILRGWEDIGTGKFYLIFFNLKSNKIEIKLTNHNNKIFKIKGFHPSTIDTQLIQPSETAFSKELTESSYPKCNYLIKVPTKTDITSIVNFCATQVIRGRKSKEITQQSCSDFPDRARKRITSNHPEISPDILSAEIDRLLAGYGKLLTYEGMTPVRSYEYKSKLESMECWALNVNTDMGHFITGSTPFFQHLEGDNFENLYCVKRLFFPIFPNLYIIFTENGYGLGEGIQIGISDVDTKEIIEHFNIELFKRCDDYIVSKELPFIGHESFPELKLIIETYLKNREIYEIGSFISCPL